MESVKIGAEHGWADGAIEACGTALRECIHIEWCSLMFFCLLLAPPMDNAFIRRTPLDSSISDMIGSDSVFSYVLW